MPPVAVHLNGGVNLPDAETVMREVARRIPHGLRRLPDGEPGERATWIGFQFARLLAAPGLRRVEASEVAHARRYGSDRRPYVGLAEGAGADDVRWPDPGYADAYATSYATFVRLRDEGVVPAGVRFQVEYPTPHAVSNFFVPDQRPRLEPAYTATLRADLDRLLAAVPHEDLAVQWDVATEIGDLEGDPGRLDETADRLAAHLGQVPDGVPTGFHLCYGDFGHVHFAQPRSLATQVRLANAVTVRARREPSWFSFTVPQDRGDEDYFAPLADLHLAPGTEPYLALVPYHPDDQPAGTTAAQVQLVDRFLPAGTRAWGICTECGLARAERDEVPPLLDLHREILAAYAHA